jgi:hypothetical protein
LNVKLTIAEQEMNKKDKVIDDLLVQAEQVQGRRKGDVKVSSHLEINLKRRVRQQQTQINNLKDENDGLKKNIKITRQAELEVEIKLYGAECVRLRR